MEGIEIKNQIIKELNQLVKFREITNNTKSQLVTEFEIQICKDFCERYGL